MQDGQLDAVRGVRRRDGQGRRAEGERAGGDECQGAGSGAHGFSFIGWDLAPYATAGAAWMQQVPDGSARSGSRRTAGATPA
ncbi:hypothetical protein GCM10009714_30300 [Microlunatus capsulatus]